MAEDSGASLADDNGLGVREDSGDGEAAGALDVHEEGSRGWNQGLYGQVSKSFARTIDGPRAYLELMLLGLGSRAGVEKVNSENLVE